MSSGSSKAKAALLTGVAFFFILFTALGLWQLERRSWKHALMERVDARIHAEPTERFAPDAEYTHVRLAGRFLPAQALVQASTKLGTGHWLMQGFATADGRQVLVNRGFVPDGAQGLPAPEGEQNLTGLLRLSEPKGRLLRENEPDAGRWFSRDVAAMASQLQLARAEPYFVDQDAQGRAEVWPQGGLTVVQFPDNHLQYALTWFALSAMCAFCGWLVIRSDSRAHESPADADNRGHAAD